MFPSSYDEWETYDGGEDSFGLDMLQRWSDELGKAKQS